MPQALEIIRKAGKRPGRADLPPKLEWECELWTWFQRLKVPQGMDGLPCADRGAFLAVVQREGWDWDIAFGLLHLIESTIAKECRESEANG